MATQRGFISFVDARKGNGLDAIELEKARIRISSSRTFRPLCQTYSESKLQMR